MLKNITLLLIKEKNDRKVVHMHATPSFGKPKIDRSLRNPAGMTPTSLPSLVLLKTSGDSKRPGWCLSNGWEKRRCRRVVVVEGGWMDRMVHALLPSTTFFLPPLLCASWGQKEILLGCEYTPSLPLACWTW